MMVRHDDEMFKVHPEYECRDDPSVENMRRRGYWVGDPSPEPVRHPDTYPGIGTTIPQYHIPPGVSPANASLDANLNIIIDLLKDIQKKLN